MTLLKLLAAMPFIIFGTLAAAMLVIHPSVQVEWLRWVMVAATVLNVSITATAIMLFNPKA